MVLDRLLGILALLFFAGFLGIIVFSVKQPVLIAVTVIGVLLCAYDFVLQLTPRRR